MDFVIAPRVVGQYDKDDQSEGGVAESMKTQGAAHGLQTKMFNCV